MSNTNQCRQAKNALTLLETPLVHYIYKLIYLKHSGVVAHQQVQKSYKAGLLTRRSTGLPREAVNCTQQDRRNFPTHCCIAVC